VESILRQSYRDFEVLILDDCSPDNTAEVARSFTDPRVKYIRNESNLGHLRNYNKGIRIGEGAFIWQISPDDYLRRPDVLERYLGVMQGHPSIGFAICPGWGVRDGVETRVLGTYSQRRDRDRIISGHAFVRKLLHGNFVMTPAVLARSDAYAKAGYYNEHMPWCGDWYLWMLMALDYDVAYFAEPMVCYHEHHDLSMTSQLTSKKLDACGAEELTVSWLLKKQVEAGGHADLADDCLRGIARTYGRLLASERYRSSSWFMNWDLFEASLREHEASDAERAQLRTQVSMSVGNEYYWQGERAMARKFYAAALDTNPWLISARMKSVLLAMGRSGDYVRRTIFTFR
jgi:glycosyltransferase involved in cell wall biosynthesis